MTWRQRINDFLMRYPLVHTQYFNGCSPWLWGTYFDWPSQ